MPEKALPTIPALVTRISKSPYVRHGPPFSISREACASVKSTTVRVAAQRTQKGAEAPRRHMTVDLWTEYFTATAISHGIWGIAV